MSPTHNCPKCNAEMQEGVLLEHRIAVRWIASKPKKTLMGNVKAGDGEHRHLESYCCPECGFVELYAKEKIR